MYCGIDVAKNKSQICIIDKDKNILHEFEIKHTNEGFKELEKYLTKDIKIGMETTANYCKIIFNFLKDKYDVCYVDNIQMKNFAKLHFSYVKNDKVDARLIANYLTFDFKKVNPIRMDELKNLARAYDKTAKLLSRYKTIFQDQINIIFPELEENFSIKSLKGLPSMLLEYSTPKQIAKASLEEVRHAIIKDLMISSIFTEEYVRKLQDLASKSVGVADYPTSYFRYNIKIMRFYQSMVNDLKKELSIALKKTIYYPLVDQFGFNEISVAKIDRKSVV